MFLYPFQKNPSFPIFPVRPTRCERRTAAQSAKEGFTGTGATTLLEGSKGGRTSITTPYTHYKTFYLPQNPSTVIATRDTTHTYLGVACYLSTWTCCSQD
jgi:hypothetical protein